MGEGAKRLSGVALSLLGPLLITVEDRPFGGIRNRPALALFLYLACRPERHRRESLMALLWPNWLPASAHHNLRQNLYFLRQALPQVASRNGGDSVPLLLADRETLQLNPDADVVVDVRRFTELLEQPQPSMAQLAAAVALYRGDFLADFYLPDSNPFEEWSAARREAYRRLALNALENLTNDSLKLVDYQAAERYTRHQLEIDNLRESAHRQLMLALAHSGQRAAALTHYESYRRVVKEELGIEASNTVRALAEQISLDKEGSAVGPEFRIQAEGPRHNFQAESTSLIGRGRELQLLDQYLRDPAVRLVTILGPGGVGKTRLALAAAEALLDDARQPQPFAQGIYFVSLASLATPALIIPAIAASIGLRFHDGSELKEQLLNYLCRKQMLLCLDNFEHLMDGAGLVDEILNIAPGVKLLITSRQKLQRQAEQLLPIGGLSLSPDAALDAEEAESDAVLLFLQRARRIRPDYILTADNRPDVLEICRLVDGMPLGIVLAAAWLDTLSTREIVVELGQDLDFLAVEGGDLPQRQRSMRAAFNHSWQLLDEHEQAVFQKLSVFRGGFTRRAAAVVANASPRNLQALINKSLLIRESSDRYVVHELLRQFAAEKLVGTRTEAAAARDGHSAYFCEFLNGHTEGWHSEIQLETLASVNDQRDNAQEGLRWALEQGHWPGLVKAIDSWMEYHQWQAYWKEAEQFCRAIVEKAEQQDRANPVIPSDCLRLWVRALLWMNDINESDRQAAVDRSQKVLALLKRPELAHLDARREEAWARASQAFHLMMTDLAESRRQFTLSLAVFQTIGDRWGIAQCLSGLGSVAHVKGQFGAALEHAEAAYEIRRAMGDRRTQVRSLHNLGLIHKLLGQLESAERLHREAVSLGRSIGEYSTLVDTQATLAHTLDALGKFDESRQVATESLEIARSLGNKAQEAGATIAVGHALINLGQYQQAYQALASTLSSFQEVGERYLEGVLHESYGSLALADGRYAEAQAEYGSCLAIFQQIAHYQLVWPLTGLGYAAYRQGNRQAARRHLIEAMTRALEIKNFFIVRALPAVALLLAADGQVGRAVAVWSLAKRYPYIANSRWFEDIAGRELDEMAALASPAPAGAVGQPGQELDLWAASAALLVELEKI